MKRKAVRRLAKDESGVAMGLAVVMVVLIGVMGAGLLTFVVTDLNAVVEVNRGQRAFEMADAGAQAAERQLDADSIPGHYDGGASDVRWSSNFVSPLGVPEPGMTLTNLDGNSATSDSVNVQIEYRSASNTLVVVSTGYYGDAKRKIETVFKRAGGAQLPPAYFTRNTLSINGSFSSDGLSFFSLGNASVTTSPVKFSLGSSPDSGLKKWAETTDSTTSYPNAFNATPRADVKGGIGARGAITLDDPIGLGPLVSKGSRSFDAATVPRVVADYYASKTTPSTNPTDPSIISFPFDTSLNLNAANVPEDIETLRAAAQQQEATTPANNNYRDTLVSGTSYPIRNADWPSSSTADTVVFYRFPSWNANNKVVWDINAGSCTSAAALDRKGVIVVENGNFEIAGNRNGFNGTVVTWGGIDPATGKPYPDRGTYTSAGGACMNGYASASGNMTLAGTFTASAVPELSSIPAFAGGVEQVSWRELYQ